jgi:hypothetical protein
MELQSSPKKYFNLGRAEFSPKVLCAINDPFMSRLEAFEFRERVFALSII